MAAESVVCAMNKSIVNQIWGILLKVVPGLLIFTLLLLLSPAGSWAEGAAGDERIQNYLEASLLLIEKAKKNLETKKPASDEIARLKAMAESLDAAASELESDLQSQGNLIPALGPKAGERHRAMGENVRNTLSEYRGLVDELGAKTSVSGRLAVVKKLKALLEKKVHKKRRPILGSLPYRDLNTPAKKPDASAPIKPAYRGGNKTAGAEDLKSTPEAPLDHEIATLAESLGWSPVAIYEYVKNHIETEWYWGGMKGAEETLRQKSGNDCDQAALLVALLRSSGYPSRYVRGTVSFFPDIEKAKNATGIEDPAKIAEFLRKAGIPFKSLVSGGKIAGFEMEHIWVESEIPYGNYRGAIIDGRGKTWLALDTSIKANDYEVAGSVDILQEFSLGGVREEYLKSEGPKTALEFVRGKIEAYLGTRADGLAYDGLLRKRVLPPEQMNILPASLQFEEKSVFGEYSAIPEALRHKVRITASRDKSVLFHIESSLQSFSNKRVALSYQPETAEDQETILSYGGLDNTPAHLVRLRPVLKVDGEPLLVSGEGLPMGADLELAIELISPGGIEKATSTHIAGNLIVLGIVAQKVLAVAPMPDEEKEAEQLLFERTIDYIDRWNKAEEELASLMHLALARPIATVATVGGVVDVAYLLDTPHRYEWKGVFLDANLRAAGVQPVSSGMEERTRLFMQLSALEGSVLEGRVFEEAFKVDSISTARLLQEANRQGSPPLTVDKSNVSQILPTLSLDENISKAVADAVARGETVTIPGNDTTYQDWQGTGFIEENPATGEAGYMLSGMINGGMTAWSADTWPEDGDYAQRLANPYSEPPNRDPSTADTIQKITATDLQNGKVGSPLARPLQVIVKDKEGRPVAGASVIFTIKAGGGKFADGTTSTTAVTSGSGIASAILVLGEKTSDNPRYVKKPEDTHAQMVGENLVAAALISGTTVVKPFAAYGYPDVPDHIHWEGGTYEPVVLAFASYVTAVIEDKYGNPIANLPVTFEALSVVEWTDPGFVCHNPHRGGYTQALLVKHDDPCCDLYPTRDKCEAMCETESPLITETTSDKGASVYVILGGISHADWPIKMSYGSLSATARLITSFMGDCDLHWYWWPPGFYPVLDVRQLVDPTHNNNVTAGKPGSLISIKAKVFVLEEQGIHMSGKLTCNDHVKPVVVDCDDIVGGNSFNVVTQFPYIEVTFAGKPGNPSCKDDGFYEGDIILAPGLNVINIKVNGKIETMRTSTSCEEGNEGCYDSLATFPFEMEKRFEAYGVDLNMLPIPIMQINQNGYIDKDYQVKYTIAPLGYTAFTAYVYLYKDGERIVSIPSEKQGEGSVTISQGFQFDINSSYEAEAVLNPGESVEIRSEKIPIVFIAEDAGNFVGLDRTYHLSRFNESVGELEEDACTDSYRTLDFEVQKPSAVSLNLFDIQSNGKGVLVSETSLSEGDYRFVVDYGTIKDLLVGSSDSPSFYLLLKMTHEDGSGIEKKIYPGRLSRRTDGKMLGQVLVHDVLIQDGSLNLTRRDLGLKGRGPELAFTRSYSNQPSPSNEFKPLGEGWSHSLDMKLRPLGYGDAGAGRLPGWVVSRRGSFFKKEDVPPNEEFTLVSVNGAVFTKKGGLWYPERGHHGTLDETNDSFTYTAKDGTRTGYGKNLFPLSNPVKTVSDKNGNIMTFLYDPDDPRGLLKTVRDAVGREFSFIYETPPGLASPRLVKVAGPDDLELIFTYNEHGYLESARRGDRIERYDYAPQSDERGFAFNLEKTTDANGNATSYEYHEPNEVDQTLATFVKVLKSGDVVKQVNAPHRAGEYAESHTARFTYDLASGNRRIVSDFNKNETVYTLNPYGNPIRMEEPESASAPSESELPKVTLMTWSIDEGKDDNVMTSKTDARGNTTAYEYDGKGNITLERDPYGHEISSTWNQKFGLPEARIDRNKVTVRWEYDPENGNLLRHEDGDGKATSYTYYATGEVQTMEDPRGNITRYEYDTYGNPARVEAPEESAEPVKSITATVCDIRGRKRAVTDPNGFTTEYTYDALDYPERIIHPGVTAYDLPEGSTGIEEFDYDPMGNLLWETNRNGLKTDYTYTCRNQVKSVARSTGGGESLGAKSFRYDGNGNLVFETDWKGIPTTHTYNGLNRRTETTNRQGDAMLMWHDPEGNLTASLDYEGRLTRYAHDALNRKTDEWQPALTNREPGHTRSEYFDEADPKTNLKSVTDQEGHTTGYLYNGRYLRTQRTDARGELFSWDYDENGNLVKETDEEGRVTEHEYGRRNHLTLTKRVGDKVTLVTAYGYDANGNRTSVTDPKTQTTRTDFDEWNRPFKVTDPEGYATETEYDGEGNKVGATDGNGHVRTWLRDALGLVRTATDAEGRQTEYRYDPNGHLTWMKEANGTVTETAYDAEERPGTTKETASSGASRVKGVILRDRAGNALRVRDYLGNITRSEYNALDLVEEVFDPAPFEAQSSRTEYLKTGKVKSVKNRRGDTTTFEYDGLGREIKKTDPLSQSIETTYDKVGNVKSVRDKRGILTENSHDDFNRLTDVTKDGIRILTNEYDGNGNITAVIDAENNRTEHTYNARNLLAATVFPPTADSPEGATELRTYDGVGNLLTLTDEEKKVTTYTYDRENRETSIEFAGEKTEKTYDKAGNLTFVKKPRGNGRKMTFDGFKRLTSVVEDPEGLNLASRFEYDANGNLANRYDPLNHRTGFEYDELGRKTQEIQEKGTGSLFTKYTKYDGEGNLKEMLDPKGQVFRYDYDELNRRVDEYFPEDSPTPFHTLLHVHRDFDANSNVTRVTEEKTAPDGSAVTDVTENRYDNFDRLDESRERGVVVSYSYDKNGNRRSVSTEAKGTVYTFDARNRLKTATADGLTTTYAYTPNGKKEAVRYPNGTSVNYTYHSANRIESVTNKSNDAILSSYAYEYDKNGNRILQKEIQNGIAEETLYHYDRADRLKGFTVTNGSDDVSTEYTFYGYNRKTEKITRNGTLTRFRTYDFDETDQLKRIDDEGGKTIIYQYDPNGNTVSKSESTLPGGDIAFTYDSKNKLVQTTRGPPEAKTILGLYDYNAEGLKIRHRRSDRGDIDITHDGKSPIEERSPSNNTLIAHYRYADRLLSLDTGTTKEYYHFDALGSTVNLSGDTGTGVASYRLDPWGHIQSQTGSSTNRRIFTGKEHDTNTGLIDFKARFYDPDTARFTTQDTYPGTLDTPPSLHRYLYAYSNPTVYIDLDGYEAVEAVGGKVYWGVQNKKNTWEIKWIEIGKYKEEDGKPKVYLTEEFGGCIVEYGRIRKAARSFWEREGTDDESLMSKSDISGYDRGYQKVVITKYINDRLNPHQELRIISTHEKDALNKYVFDYEQLEQDLYAVNDGRMTGADFVGKYGYKTVEAVLFSKAVGQIASELKEPAQRIIRDAVEKMPEAVKQIGQAARRLLADDTGAVTLKGAAKNTRFIEGVKAVDRRTGNVLEGTVDLRPTLDRIAQGRSFPHRNDGSIFQNRPLRGQTTSQLPVKPQGYYKEYVHPTPGVSGPGPQRIVTGQGGEIYYTPDHYTTFIRVNP